MIKEKEIVNTFLKMVVIILGIATMINKPEMENIIQRMVNLYMKVIMLMEKGKDLES